MVPGMDRRRVALSMLAFALALIALVVVDARLRRRAIASSRDTALAAIVDRLPGPDLAVAVGARHLRSPSLEEPGAAFTDEPASPDVDPAGGAVAPPRAVWVDEALERERHNDSRRDDATRPRGIDADRPGIQP